MKGCAARRHPWGRDEVKEMSNRHNNDRSQHPQVFRQIEEEIQQMKEIPMIFDKQLVSPEVYHEEYER